MGLNARPADYLVLNKKNARRKADDKLLTKKMLKKMKVSHPKLLGTLSSVEKIRKFDWNKLREGFVVKPVQINWKSDLAYLQFLAEYNYNTASFGEVMTALSLISAPDVCVGNQTNLGDKLYVIGFPYTGGDTVTITEGIISGFDGRYVKTSAKIEHGNSGGLAIHASGCSIGIASAANVGTTESLGLIINLMR